MFAVFFRGNGVLKKKRAWLIITMRMENVFPSVLGLIQPIPVRAHFSQTADAVNSSVSTLELVFFS